jgi:tetratricopeptide (TPR) repeat protein
VALRDFEQAIRLDPSLADALAGRGTARVGLGEYREAVADAESAARLDPSDHRVVYKAARIYALAAVAATSEVRSKGRGGVALPAKYEDRAIELVGAARDRVPAAERSTFETVLQTDPALGTIRRRIRSVRPAGTGAQAARDGKRPAV